MEGTRSHGLDDASKECRQPRGETGTHQHLRPSTGTAHRGPGREGSAATWKKEG